MTANSDNQERLTATKNHQVAESPASDPARDYFNRAVASLKRSEWDKAEIDLSTASHMGKDIVALFRAEHGSIAAFEKEENVRLPREILMMLASDKGEKLRAAAGGWVGLHDPEELKRMLYQARIDGSREPPTP